MEEGFAKALQLDTDINAVNMILTFDLAGNGAAGRRAWKALKLPPACRSKKMMKGAGSPATRMTTSCSSPPFAQYPDLDGGYSDRSVATNYGNVHNLMPWRTITGRQSFYLDHLDA